MSGLSSMLRHSAELHLSVSTVFTVREAMESANARFDRIVVLRIQILARPFVAPSMIDADE
jgi:hypothetical protein